MSPDPRPLTQLDVIAFQNRCKLASLQAEHWLVQASFYKGRVGDEHIYFDAMQRADYFIGQFRMLSTSGETQVGLLQVLSTMSEEAKIPVSPNQPPP